ncbi:histidine phosphatase family protein [uncultured Enterovirga sp.]|uniref:histidine phosphatase family protein n=1 Tax=uncultured Enterovirga sp. TaxID=2026352 RepID=UPI0035CAB6CC
MGEATTVYLVRHAAHDRVGRVLCGRMPGVSLGAAGRSEAAALAARFVGEEIAAVMSSPLERARETAGPIAAALRLPVTTCQDLNEIDFGAWTGRAFADLDGDPAWADWNHHRAEGCPPGGEAMHVAQSRAVGAVQGWQGLFPGRAVVAVSHADVLKSVICSVLGLSLDRLHSFDVAPASVSALVLWAGGGKVLSVNERVAGPTEASLSGLAA